ncbi:hypothetical protein VTL71DRAFT_6446 [Oculimacula yallundae]
MPRILEL